MSEDYDDNDLATQAILVVTYDPDVFEDARAVAEYLHNSVAVLDSEGIADVSTYTSPTEAGGGA